MNKEEAQPATLLLPPEGGFLIIDKPRGPSSHQVTAWVRDMMGVSKAGHSGTLDPGVSGILVISVGKALRLLPLLLQFPKRYIGLVQLHSAVRTDDLTRALEEFHGEIFQTPPVRSAVKRERRVRRIHDLKLLEVEGTMALLDVTCESGTYIRTLAVDLGEALGVGAHLAELRRVESNPFTEAEAVTLANLADAIALAKEGKPESLAAVLHPPSEVWKRVPAVVIKDTAVDALAHGADLASPGVLKVTHPFAKGARVVLVTRLDELVATGKALVDSKGITSAKHGWVVDAERVFIPQGTYPSSWKKGPPKAE
jgi:predicted rRNA pseudouridine synthase